MTDQDEDMAGDLAAWTRWQAESKPDVAALRAEIATLRQQNEAMRAALHQWAIYCFTKHGNDAHLYNGLADLARE
jgi:hypothetical protein